MTLGYRFSAFGLAAAAFLSAENVHGQPQGALGFLGPQGSAAPVDLWPPRVMAEKSPFLLRTDTKLQCEQRWGIPLSTLSEDVDRFLKGDQGFVSGRLNFLNRERGWVLDATESLYEGCIRKAGKGEEAHLRILWNMRRRAQKLGSLSAPNPGDSLVVTDEIILSRAPDSAQWSWASSYLMPKSFARSYYCSSQETGACLATDVDVMSQMAQEDAASSKLGIPLGALLYDTDLQKTGPGLMQGAQSGGLFGRMVGHIARLQQSGTDKEYPIDHFINPPKDNSTQESANTTYFNEVRGGTGNALSPLNRSIFLAYRGRFVEAILGFDNQYINSRTSAGRCDVRNSYPFLRTLFRIIQIAERSGADLEKLFQEKLEITARQFPIDNPLLRELSGHVQRPLIRLRLASLYLAAIPVFEKDCSNSEYEAQARQLILFSFYEAARLGHPQAALHARNYLKRNNLLDEHKDWMMVLEKLALSSLEQSAHPYQDVSFFEGVPPETTFVRLYDFFHEKRAVSPEEQFNDTLLLAELLKVTLDELAKQPEWWKNETIAERFPDADSRFFSQEPRRQVAKWLNEVGLELAKGQTRRIAADNLHERPERLALHFFRQAAIMTPYSTMGTFSGHYADFRDYAYMVSDTNAVMEAVQLSPFDSSRYAAFLVGSALGLAGLGLGLFALSRARTRQGILGKRIAGLGGALLMIGGPSVGCQVATRGAEINTYHDPLKMGVAASRNPHLESLRTLAMNETSRTRLERLGNTETDHERFEQLAEKSLNDAQTHAGRGGESLRPILEYLGNRETCGKRGDRLYDLLGKKTKKLMQHFKDVQQGGEAIRGEKYQELLSWLEMVSLSSKELDGRFFVEALEAKVVGSLGPQEAAKLEKRREFWGVMRDLDEYVKKSGDRLKPNSKTDLAPLKTAIQRLMNLDREKK